MSSLVNKVVIEPDADHMSASGVVLHDGVDEQKSWSITGTVLHVPEKLIFHGDRVKKLMKKRSRRNVALAQKLSAESLQYGSTMDLSVGDRVYYMFSAKFDRDLFWFGGNLVIPYDMIIAKDGCCGGLVPLNGKLLVSVMEKPEREMILDGMYVVNDDVNDYGYGKVKYVGKNISGYLQYAYPSPGGILPGNKIYYDKALAWRLEMDMHNSLNKGRQSSLFVVDRKDVLWIST